MARHIFKEGEFVGPANTLLLKRIKSTKCLWKCSYCGAEFIADTRQISNGVTKSCGCLRVKRCIEFNHKKTKDITNKRFGKLIALSIAYKKDNRVYWKCQCDCGNKTIVRYGDLTRKPIGVCSCGKCQISKGELKVKQLLQQLNITFEQQKVFSDCLNDKTGYPLKFDFYLPDYNCCIEYDGEQHFKEVSLCSSSLVERQKKDLIKNNYCKKNNIKLIRIPYTDYKIINKEYFYDRIK